MVEMFRMGGGWLKYDRGLKMEGLEDGGGSRRTVEVIIVETELKSDKRHQCNHFMKLN